MNTSEYIIMNIENSKTSAKHMLLVNSVDKVNSKRIDKYVAFSNPSIYYTRKIQKN